MERLLEDPPPAETRSAARWLAVPVAAAALAPGYAPLLRLVHGVTEILVNTLP